MRRILTILLMLVLGIGPAMAAVPTGALSAGWDAIQNDSRLPACCRRNGAHHCAMTQMNSGDNKQTSLSAPNCCPCMPHAVASTVVSDYALVGSAAHQSALLSEARTAQASETAARISAMRTWPKRGPPSLQTT
ncbi:hypothetical protein [Acidicapsa ligni]|uniref:hypothetical protein n=1 Tax=Acidicapsa ligni TaxID=542300 RepID=UPI0021DF61AE|nr:hypothetical protein [Acidicapsa ligni]